MIHILHLEDDPVDSQLAAELLRLDGLDVEMKRVHTLMSFKDNLGHPSLNLILSDYTIPGTNVLDALRLARQTRPDIPFIFLSGTIGEERAIESLKKGATDYVLKEHSSRLASAVRRALEEAEQRSRRKASEQELAKTTARLDGIISSAMDAIISINAEHRIVLFNPAAEKVFGIKSAQALGKNINDFIPEQYRDAHTRHVEEFSKTGVSSRAMGQLGTLSGLRVNGEEFPIEASISQTEVEGEKLFTVILRDVTARRKAEEDLRTSEEKFAKAFAENPAAIILTHLEDGRLLEVNETWVTLFGYRREEVIGASVGQFSIWPSAEDRFRFLQQLKASGLVRGWEQEFIKKSGEIFVAQLAAQLLNMRGEPVVISALVDITARKQAETALQESEERFRTLADNISQFAWMADQNGWVLWYNKRWFEYTGTTLENMQGWGWQTVHHPDHVQRVVEKLRHCYQTGESWEDTFPLRGRDGQYRWFLSRARPIRDQQGKVVRWFGTSTDITTQKDLEANLERLVGERTSKLEEAMESLQHFSYTITHDLRAPLRAMRGYADLLLDENLAEKSTQDLLRRIRSSTERMGQLIDDALNYSILTQQTLELVPVDVGALIEEIVDSYPNLQPHKDRITIAERMPSVLGNKAALTQCFSNLLTNAIKFTQTGKAPEIRIWAEVIDTNPPQEPSRVRLWVQDNGIGISKEHLGRMFVMFERLNAQREGTGIGLALVKKAVERMGGRAGVESELGKGSRFWIELKKATSEP